MTQKIYKKNIEKKRWYDLTLPTGKRLSMLGGCYLLENWEWLQHLLNNGATLTTWSGYK